MRPAAALYDISPAKLAEDLPVFFYHSRDDEVVPIAHLALYAERLPQATMREFGAKVAELVTGPATVERYEVAVEIAGGDPA